MLLIEYVGHIGLRSLTDGHLGRHLEYFKTLNDVRVASLGFIKYNAPTTIFNKEKNFNIKFQVNLVFYRTRSLIISLLKVDLISVWKKVHAMKWLFIWQRFSSMLFFFQLFISSKYDFHVDSERMIVKREKCTEISAAIV